MNMKPFKMQQTFCFVFLNLLILTCSSESRENSKVLRDFVLESCPLGLQLTCPPDLTVWACFCFSNNTTISLKCNAESQENICPEPLELGNRIGGGLPPQAKDCNDFVNLKCNSNAKETRTCYCKSLIVVSIKCTHPGKWTNMNGSPLNCAATPGAPAQVSPVVFPTAVTREPKIQNSNPLSHVPPQPQHFPDHEDPNHEEKYGEVDYNNYNTFNIMNNNGQFDNNRPTRRPFTNPTSRPVGRPNNNAQVRPEVPKCKKPIILIVVIVCLAVAVAVLAGFLFVITKRYKLALQQVIHMNELYTSRGMDKGKTLPQIDKLAEFKEKKILK